MEENKINKSLKSDKKYEFMEILGQSTSNKVKILFTLIVRKEFRRRFLVIKRSC
jgi:hypothetical protein